MRKPVAVGVTLLILLSGCGPSLAEYITQADLACAVQNRVIQAISAPDSVAKIKEFGESLARATNDTVKPLNTLKKPRGDEGARVDAVIKDMRAAANTATTLAAAAGKEDLPGTETAVNEVRDAYQKLDTTARTAGFKACGQAGAASSGTLATASPAILKNAFIAKADARCATANKELEGLPEPETEQQLVELFDKIIAIAQQLFTDLRAIPPAAADKAAVDDVLAENDRAVAKLAEARDAAKAGQSDRADALFEQFAEISNAANVKADRFGFRDCGSAGGG